MELTVNSKIIASVQLHVLQLAPMLGSFELVFQFAEFIHGKSDEVYRWLTISGGRVTLRTQGGNHIELGMARPDGQLVIRQADNSRNDQFSLKLALQPYQIEMLEALRAGSDLNFKIRFLLRGNTSKSDGGDWEELGDNSIDVTVPQSAWAQQMTLAKADHILLFEVRLPAGDTVTAHPAARHLLRAREHLTGGNWRECVSECRQFAEELGGSRLSPALQQLSSDRRAMTKDERSTVLVAALHHYAHLAVHSESQHGDLDFDRADARLALSIAASLASYYFRRD